MPAKLRTAAKQDTNIPSEEILETLLVEAGAAGELPTNANKLLNFLGLEQLSFDFMQDLDFGESAQKPPGELRAALHLSERVVATQSGLGEKRTRFSIFHEIAHCVLPEHNSKLFFDTDQTLSWWTKFRFEREANQFAADLLFQGKHFAEQALGLHTSIQSVIDLAPQYGASYEAALRRYTEAHVLPCALIVYNKAAHNEEGFMEDDEYKVHYTIASAPFRKLYFSGVQMSEEKCKPPDIYGANQSWATGRIVEKEIVIEEEGKEKWRFETEVFSNGYKIFQFLKRPISKSAKK